jgi:tape measure domain-containing protein
MGQKMATVGSLVVNLLGNTSQFRSEFGQVPGILGGVTGSVMNLLGIGAGLAGFGRGIQLAANAESAAVSFEVLTGSVEKTKKILSELQQWSDKSPYSLAGGTEATRLLLNFGITAEQALPTLRMLGDIAGGDEQKLHSLALAFGQSSSAGRLMGQDLNQMINAGFNPLVEISKRTGETMSALKARMEAGGISTAEVTQAFRDATTEGGRFYGMTERQSGTMAGQWSTLRDTIDGVLRQIGQQLIDTFDLKKVLSEGIGYLQGWSQWIKQNANDLVTIGGIIVGFVAGLTAIRVALFAAAQAQAVLRALSGPVGWATLAAGIMGAVVVAEQLNLMFDATSMKLMGVTSAAKGTAEALKEIGGGSDQSALSAEINRLEAIRAELKKPDLSPNYRKGLETKESASQARIDSLTAIAGPAQAAQRPVDVLWQKLNDLTASARSMSEENFELFGGPAKIAAITDKIGELSGATEKIRSLRDQIAGVTSDELERRKLSEAGASNEQIAEIEQLQEQAKAMKELMTAREQLISKTESPAEKFQKELENLHKLNAGGFITDEQFTRGKQLAANDLVKGEEKDDEKPGKSTDRPLDAIFAASRESQSAILRGITNGNTNPNKKLESLAERQARAAEKANTILASLADEDSANVTVIDYP